MYPTIYHFFQYNFGISIGFLQVVNTFGFFVALSIAGAFWVFQKEMERKTNEGKFPWVNVKVVSGKPYPLSDYIFNGFLAFIFGYKILYLLTNTGDGFTPQEHIFTTEGSLIWGIVLAAVVLGFRYRADVKQRLPEPLTEEKTMDASYHMGNITTIALLSGFAGAKLFHILEDLNNLTIQSFVANLFSSGGWTFYGGLVCGAAGVLIYCYKKGLGLLHMLDSGGPGMMLSYGIGRLGCHFSGDGDWGLANTHAKPFAAMPDWLWAYTYPHNVLGTGNYPPAEMIQIPGFKGDYSYELMIPVYPTPLYEAIMGLILFVILWKVFRYRKMAAGNMFALYMIFAGVERFLIENIREHGTSLYTVGKTSFSQAQMISVILILLGGVWLLFSGKLKPKPQAD